MSAVPHSLNAPAFVFVGHGQDRANLMTGKARLRGGQFVDAYMTFPEAEPGVAWRACCYSPTRTPQDHRVIGTVLSIDSVVLIHVVLLIDAVTSADIATSTDTAKSVDVVPSNDAIVPVKVVAPNGIAASVGIVASSTMIAYNEIAPSIDRVMSITTVVSTGIVWPINVELVINTAPTVRRCSGPIRIPRMVVVNRSRIQSKH